MLGNVLSMADKNQNNDLVTIKKDGL